MLLDHVGTQAPPGQVSPKGIQDLRVACKYRASHFIQIDRNIGWFQRRCDAFAFLDSAVCLVQSMTNIGAKGDGVRL